MESGSHWWRQPLTEDIHHHSSHLRDFLRAREDDNDNGRNSGRTTLSSVFHHHEKRSSPAAHSHRTLLDIIRDDSTAGNKKTWKNFRDKLRLRRAGAAWTSSVPIPPSDIPIMSQQNNNNPLMSRRTSSNNWVSSMNAGDDQTTLGFPDSTIPEDLPANPLSSRSMLRRNTSSISHGRSFIAREANGDDDEAEKEEEEEAEEGTKEDEGVGAEAEAEEERRERAPVRMSLMALLAETDKEMGMEGSLGAILMGEDEDEDDEDEEGRDGDGGEYNNCCVCMVRHKGAALIPCGHTFCRLCSRELWVQRGNCPLCNGYILEILDIF